MIECGRVQANASLSQAPCSGHAAFSVVSSTGSCGIDATVRLVAASSIYPDGVAHEILIKMTAGCNVRPLAALGLQLSRAL